MLVPITRRELAMILIGFVDADHLRLVLKNMCIFTCIDYSQMLLYPTLGVQIGRRQGLYVLQAQQDICKDLIMTICNKFDHLQLLRPYVFITFTQIQTNVTKKVS